MNAPDSHGSVDVAGRLLGLAHDWLAARGSACLDTFLPALGRVRIRASQPAARCLPVLGWVGQLVGGASPSSTALTAALVAAASDLRWDQTYAEEDFGARFLARYGWTELAGQRGPYASEEVAIGFLMLGPGVDYPAHHHVAEEVYAVLSGRAAWSRAGGSLLPREPGELIHHPSGMPHAMRTFDQPLLALYLWRGGDLAQKSTIV